MKLYTTRHKLYFLLCLLLHGQTRSSLRLILKTGLSSNENKSSPEESAFNHLHCLLRTKPMHQANYPVNYRWHLLFDVN